MKKIDRKSHLLWVELLNQKTISNSTKILKTNNSSSDVDSHNVAKSNVNANLVSYKSQEEYYDEIILLKQNIVNLKGENEILKSKLRKSDENCNKKEKELIEVIKCFENQNLIRDSSIKTFISMKKLQQNIFQLKSEVKSKETEILNIKNESKYTKINEIKLQNETFLQEIRSLQQIISNFNSNELSSDLKLSKPLASSRVSENVKYKSLLKKNKQLIQENKNIKKETIKQMQEEFKKFDIKSKGHSKEEYIQDIKHYKTQLTEQISEKNNIQKNFDDLNEKFLKLQSHYELKLEECETSKNKYENNVTDNKTTHQKKAEIIEKPDDDIKNRNIKTRKFIQGSIISYINREIILKKISEYKTFNHSNKLESIINDALLGYKLREKSINNSF